jgi:hypothetical protein
MLQAKNEQIKNSKKTVIIAAECLSGFMEAGHFAAKFLFEKHTRIILLNTYQHPMAAISSLRKIDLVLKRNAKDDLSRIKSTLISDYALDSDQIEMLSVEGDLSNAIGTRFNEMKNASIVLHFDLNQGSYCKLITSLLQVRPGPIFLLSGFLTVFERTRVVINSDKEKGILPGFLNCILALSEQKGFKVDIVSEDSEKATEFSADTAFHFSKKVNALGFSKAYQRSKSSGY